MTIRSANVRGQSRRSFVKSAATVAAGAAAAGVTGAARGEGASPPNALAAGTSSGRRAQPAAGKKAAAKKKEIERIFLFIHPPSTLSYRELLKPNPTVEENFKKVVAEKGPDEKNFACILQGGKGDKPLVEAACRHFGDRCIVDPNDNSDETLILLARDLERTFRGRGNHGEWNHYELWSSNNARRWTEGFKKRLAEKGYTYDPKRASMETFGNWTGCHHKYSNFMARYLELSAPAVIHAETHLSTLKGFPMAVKEFVECIPLDRHVLLLMFRREDGWPMAQYWDGLRAIWEPPHTATVTMNPRRVEIFTFSTNALIPVSGETRTLPDGFIADVGDGCHAAYTTIVGRGKGPAFYKEFRTALAGATIGPRHNRRTVMWAIEV